MQWCPDLHLDLLKRRRMTRQIAISRSIRSGQAGPVVRSRVQSDPARRASLEARALACIFRPLPSAAACQPPGGRPTSLLPFIHTHKLKTTPKKPCLPRSCSSLFSAARLAPCDRPARVCPRGGESPPSARTRAAPSSHTASSTRSVLVLLLLQVEL